MFDDSEDFQDPCQPSKSTLLDEIDKFLHKLKPILIPNEFQKLDETLQNKYQTVLKGLPQGQCKILAKEINQTAENVIKDPEQKWKYIFDLTEAMDSIKNASSSGDCSTDDVDIADEGEPGCLSSIETISLHSEGEGQDGDGDSVAQAINGIIDLNNNNKAVSTAKTEPLSETSAEDEAKKKKITSLSKKLQYYKKKINELDEQEVDFDDESKSAYMKHSYFMDKYVELHNEYSNLTESENIGGATASGDHFAGQRPWNLNQICKYPEIEQEIETFLMSRAPTKYTVSDAPDFPDILEIVKHVNEKSKLLISRSEVRQLAVHIFKAIMELVKVRNLEDLACAVPGLSDDLEDPADKDEELARKLEQNKLTAIDEKIVLERFVQKSMLEVLTEDEDDNDTQMSELEEEERERELEITLCADEDTCDSSSDHE